MVCSSTPEKLGDFLLVEPEGLGFVEDFDPDRPLLGLVEDQIAFGGFVGVGHENECLVLGV